MSTSNSTIQGKFDEVTGKVKQAVGEATHNDNLANEGAAQQVKGHAEQSWGAVKEAAQDLKERHQPQAEQTAHDLRDKVTSAAQTVRDHVQAGVDGLRNKN
jgi:uncharacterized protein YjbJ (UPF0337 family)